MPAIQVNAKSFLINSDYPLDKVVYLNQGSVNIGGGVDRLIAHGLPFTPLVSFVWSFTADFAITYQYNNGPFPSGNPGYYFSLQLSIQADATNITLSGNGPIASTTIYYRIFAFVPDDYVGDIAYTTSLADNFILNTDLNYTKLFLSGSIALGANALATITHNLGYYPQVMAWGKPSTGTTIYPAEYESPYNLNTEVTTTGLNFNNQDFSSTTVYYRIYLDD